MSAPLRALHYLAELGILLALILAGLVVVYVLGGLAVEWP